MANARSLGRFKCRDTVADWTRGSTEAAAQIIGQRQAEASPRPRSIQDLVRVTREFWQQQRA
jgi:hypothetical protein